MKTNVLIYPAVILAAFTVFLGAMELYLYSTISASLSFVATLFVLASLRRQKISVPPEVQAKLASLEESTKRLQSRIEAAESEALSLKTQNASYVALLETKKKEAALSAESARSDEQAVIQFVRNLQERGRFLDFLMADIHALPDAQVGAVARVVHSGLRSLMDDYFSIQAIASVPEGSTIPIPEAEVGRSYRLLQSSSDKTPESGILVHKGWLAKSIKLPQSQRVEADLERRVLAFAEVDVKSSSAGVH